MTKLRSAEDVQKAHDRIVGILLGEAPRPEGVCLTALQQVATVLCWVLEHDHNDAFAKLLARIEKEHAELGIVLANDPEARRH